MTASSVAPGDDVSRWHIVPINDWREHEPSCACWCNPQPDDEDDRVMLHNAMDQRDSLERGEIFVQ